MPVPVRNESNERMNEYTPICTVLSNKNCVLLSFCFCSVQYALWSLCNVSMRCQRAKMMGHYYGDELNAQDLQ